MIVCDLGDRWQIVMQTDHADLSGELARRWKPSSERSDSVAIAAERHDDGWAVWEQAPICDLETGKPVNFLDVGVLSHLAFYRAGIAAVTEQDPYAGLLVSMHGAGIYRGRYGLQPELKLTFAADAGDQIDAFVAEQERGFAERDAEVGVTEEQRRKDYELLQIYDRMSLLFCMNDALAPPASEFSGYGFRPDGAATITVDPFPFDGVQQRFSLLRRVLPKTRWRNESEFRGALFDTDPERISISVLAPDGG